MPRGKRDKTLDAEFEEKVDWGESNKGFAKFEEDIDKSIPGS
jgi:hypothetical protein